MVQTIQEVEVAAKVTKAEVDRKLQNHSSKQKGIDSYSHFTQEVTLKIYDNMKSPYQIQK